MKDLRVKAQSMVDPGEMKEKFSRRGESSSSTGDGRIKSSHNLFKKPRKFDECRICAVLETEGVDNDLYEDHISDDVVGCPKFQAMSCDERRRISLKAKFCLRCCDKDTVFVPDHPKT